MMNISTTSQEGIFIFGHQSGPSASQPSTNESQTEQQAEEENRSNGYTPAMCDFSLVTLPSNSSVYTSLKTFSVTFDRPHTYLSIFICLLGTGCNLCNITVLSRRSMRTAVNMILCAIASCDTVVMLSNLVFITHFNLEASDNCAPQNWSRNWSLFAYLHSQVALIGHSSSVWLSVMLGHLRYNTLRSRGGQMRSRKPEAEMVQAYASIVSVLISVTVFNVPNCLAYSIQEIPMAMFCGREVEWKGGDGDVENNGTFGYMPSISEMAVARGCLLFRLAFWISGLLFKVIPCVLLTIFLVVLVRILAEVKERRKRLARGKKLNGKQEGVAPTDRTTRMLITVICVFLATELPQGFMGVATGIFSREFQTHIYQNVGDVLDLLSLINSCSTFVIYCSMSKQYRTEFSRAFLPPWLFRRRRHRGAKERRGGFDENGLAAIGTVGTEEMMRKGSSATVVDYNYPSILPLRKRFQAELRNNSIVTFYRKISGSGEEVLSHGNLFESSGGVVLTHGKQSTFNHRPTKNSERCRLTTKPGSRDNFNEIATVGGGSPYPSSFLFQPPPSDAAVRNGNSKNQWHQNADPNDHRARALQYLDPNHHRDRTPQYLDPNHHRAPVLQQQFLVPNHQPSFLLTTHRRNNDSSNNCVSLTKIQAPAFARRDSYTNSNSNFSPPEEELLTRKTPDPEKSRRSLGQTEEEFTDVWDTSTSYPSVTGQKEAYRRQKVIDISTNESSNGSVTLQIADQIYTVIATI